MYRADRSGFVLRFSPILKLARGYIEVDDNLATNVPGIWALGDCNGRGAFTHTAYNDYEIVAANLLDGANRRVSERLPGYALYIDPPLGRVGMAETEKTKAKTTVLATSHVPMLSQPEAVAEVIIEAADSIQ
jgi:pyruvate/2-oxoglutarate dehydrogenase complex dihydrolipoamide dehydrogenase (E3) component